MTMTEDVVATPFIGSRRLRREDPALLTGEAKYTDDIPAVGALHLAVLRSPHAHARIVSIDVSGALAIPGVVAAYTGEDLASQWAAPMPCAWPVTAEMKNPAHYPIAMGKVAYVGDGVVAVVATNHTASRDALDAIVVEYDVLPAVIDLEDALSDRVVIHESAGTTAITASGSCLPMIAAASATHGAVFRPIGSAMMCLTCDNCLRTSGACSRLVTTIIRE